MISRRFFRQAARLIITLLVLLATTSLPATGADDVTLRLKWIKDVTSGGSIIAEGKGLFEKNGLNVKVLPGGFDLNPIKLVAAGSDTFGVTGADDLLLARAQGVPIVAIGVEYQKTPVVFVTKKESGITTPRDFVGKKVGVKFGSDAGSVYMALMAKLEIDRKKLTEVPLKWDMTPFFTGQVDVLPGYSVNEPLVAQSQGFDINVLRAQDYGINIYGNVYFTSEKILKEKPELAKKFIASVIQGWQYVFSHPSDTIATVMKSGERLNEQQQLQIYDAMLPLFVPENGRFCWMTREGWEGTQQMLLEVKMLEKPLEIDKAYSMEPLQAFYK